MYANNSSSAATQVGIAVAAALAGAGLMYFFDPRLGRRRRAQVSDQVTRGLQDSREFAQKVRVDADNRVRGLYHQSRSALRRASRPEGSDARDTQPEFLQNNWAPAPRVLAGTIGLGLIASCFGESRTNAATAALGLAGAAILIRAATNRPMTQLFGLSRDEEQGFLIQKTMDVYAEADEVYTAWRALENFPKFMTHIREINRIDERRYKWTVEGPGGVPVTWESEITADVPNELIAWRTVPDSAVYSSGTVQFEPSSAGGTRIHVRMCYRPPGNAVGHAAAVVFGKDPRKQIDDDLMRFKSVLEMGRTTTDEGTVVRH